MQKVVVASGLGVAIKPPDEDNPYGYRKAEPVAAHRLYLLGHRHIVQTLLDEQCSPDSLGSTAFADHASSTSQPSQCAGSKSRQANSLNPGNTDSGGLSAI
jgi:hypothetical protein